MSVLAPVLKGEVGVPAPRLLALVHRYRGYRYEGFAPGRHLGLPSRHLTVVLSLGAPTRLAALPNPAQPPGEYSTLVSGLHTRPAAIAHDGAQYGGQLDLTPAGACSLFALPSAELAGHTVGLDALISRQACELAAAPDGAARFAVLDEALSRRVDRRPAVPDRVERARTQTARTSPARTKTAMTETAPDTAAHTVMWPTLRRRCASRHPVPPRRLRLRGRRGVSRQHGRQHGRHDRARRAASARRRWRDAR